MTAARLPVSAVSSLALHAGLVLLYLQTGPLAKREVGRVIADVDLLVQVRKAAPLPAPAPKPVAPVKTWDFLKMALPAVPRAAAPAAIDVKLPERKAVMAPEPEKLLDRGRRELEKKVEALDLGRRRTEAVKLDAEPLASRRSAAALAQAPRLEEVGRRRVRDLPQAIKLEERRREAVAMSQLEALAPMRERRALAPAVLDAPVLREARPSERVGLGERLAAIAPLEHAAQAPLPVAGPDPDALRKQLELAKPAVRRPRAAALEETKKKAVEIEGPLADRKVEYYEAPDFPAWLKDQGVLEAAVSIRFGVSPDGAVLPDMRVERTSGYGRLDRLTMDFLKKWRFAPIGTQEKQWGIITFRYIVE